jgi:hypothetical protein
MSMDELALPLPAVHPRYGRLHFAAMGAADLDAVLSIEEAVYSHPGPAATSRTRSTVVTRRRPA